MLKQLKSTSSGNIKKYLWSQNLHLDGDSNSSGSGHVAQDIANTAVLQKMSTDLTNLHDIHRTTDTKSMQLYCVSVNRQNVCECGQELTHMAGVGGN